ncbi:Rid family detoxifying hydrolase [Candidatus Blochmannia vicinus]|uniref:Rid family detoxifying hydrolase n=1 Tax=Candidatus Blochmannia vicinus (nom. nud.) TaxID=251540 RepID=A0ABY4SYW7_9ENTR|nr:Rid family detoxifying hydrolase [Candidatus Blochmannia vicinus]URJ32736.1 Rid family detoxifying hydrolase [Candidatus Blochmannia vicinus]
MQKHIMTINTKNAPAPLGPYAQAVKIENNNIVVFVSGQIPICPDTNTMSDNIYDQTHQALLNIKNIIETTGLKINNIVKTTLFIIDFNDLSKINTSYENFFNTYSAYEKTTLPARSCVGIFKLPKNAKIEIEAIAMHNFL